MFTNFKFQPLVSFMRSILLIAFCMLFSGCIEHRHQDRYPESVPIASFIEMAQQSKCHDLKNKLYIIDNHLVYWERAGNCTDNGFGKKLFGDSTHVLLCEQYDSINGPKIIYYNESFHGMFDTILAHSDQPNLGLPWSHDVQEIHF